MKWTKKCGERLRETRVMKEISLRDAAERAGVSAVVMGEWERGKASPEFQDVTELAAVLKVSAPYLLCETDDPQGYGELGPHPRMRLPTHREQQQRRDKFAAAALTGLLAGGYDSLKKAIPAHKMACKIADALIEDDR